AGRAGAGVVPEGGRRLVAAGHEIADRVHQEVLAELPPASRGVFVGSLTQLVGGLLAEPVASERPVRRARPGLSRPLGAPPPPPPVPKRLSSSGCIFIFLPLP